MAVTIMIFVIVVVLSLLLLDSHGHEVVKRQEGGAGRGPESREVTPGSGVYAFTTTPSSHISMFIITSDGVMVIDPMSRNQAEQMLVEIRKITSAPIKYEG